MLCMGDAGGGIVKWSDRTDLEVRSSWVIWGVNGNFSVFEVFLYQCKVHFKIFMIHKLRYNNF